MIQYLGLDFQAGPGDLRAVATAVDRTARVLGGGTAPVVGASAVEGAPADTREVRPGEWVRAGSLALKDAFFRIPARSRKVWGISLAGPDGWIALDPEFDPIVPLRLTPRPLDDFLAWLAAHPRERSHIFLILPPKDYFRFAISKGVATDMTQAAGFGLLDAARGRWSQDLLAGRDLPEAWFPTVFDSAVPTGRISEEGIEKTGLPGGLWVVAGARSGAAAVLSAGDLLAGAVLVGAAGAGAIEIRALAAGAAGPAPAGFEALPAPIAGHRVLRRIAGSLDPTAAVRAVEEALGALRGTPVPGLREPERVIVDWRPGAEPAWLPALLAGSPLPASPSPFAGEEDPGTGFLAGMAQGAYREAPVLHRKIREAAAADRAAEEAEASRETGEEAGGEDGESGR